MTFDEIETKYQKALSEAKQNYRLQMEKILTTIGMNDKTVIRKKDGKKGRLVLKDMGMFKCEVTFVQYLEDGTLCKIYAHIYNSAPNENDIIKYLLENFVVE